MSTRIRPMTTLMLGVAVQLAWAGLPAIAADEPAPPQRADKIRLLIVTGGHDFDRDAFFKLFQQPDITWKEVKHPEAVQWFAPDKAADYDVMLWYDCMRGPISEADQANLLALLKKGKGLVVLHHALIDYPDWPEGKKIIGGRYYDKPPEGHPLGTYKHGVTMAVKIADAAHPITRFMKDFEIEDEAYNHYEIEPGVRPLLTAEHPESAKLIGWTHTYAKSPVAFIQLGHGPTAYTNPNYQRLVVQAVRWAAGRLPEADKGFVELFNGKDLAGWKVIGDAKGFTIKDGILRSESGKGGLWLRSEKQYGDYALRVEWRVGKEGNAGVFLRVPEGDMGQPWISGTEVQISNQQRDLAHCTGSLYGVAAVDPRPDESPDAWHEFWIECRGPRITVFADNLPVVEVDGRKLPALTAKPLRGYIGLQDSHNPTGYIEYRRVAVKELTMDTGRAEAKEPVWKLGTQAYTFRLFTFFEAIDKAKGLGLKYLEAYPGQKLSKDRPDDKWDHNASPEVRRLVKDKLAREGITLINYGVVDLGKTEASMRKVFDFAKDMGIETIVAEPAPGTFDLLDKLTEEYQINVAIHNHPRPSHYWNAQTVLDVVQGHSRRIGACADTGHWVRSGLDPVDCLRKLQGRIVSLHFKDLNKRAPDAHDVPWGSGVCDVKGLLSELHRQKFSGEFSVEYEHSWENSVPEIAEGLKYFKQVARELGQKVE